MTALLPAGSAIGVSLTDAGGTDYDGVTCSNIKYTTSDGSAWSISGAAAQQLTTVEGKAIAYYPYSSSATDMTKIPVTAESQPDYMYSGWVDGLDNAAPSAAFKMEHALAAVRVVLAKSEAYTQTLTATALSVQSDMFHESATLDATSGSLSGLTGAGATIADNSMSMTVTTSGVTKDFIVIPGTTAADISFMATINGQDYTAGTAATQPLQAGYIYTYTLTLSTAGFTVSSVGVTQWNKQDMGSLEMEKYAPWKNLANGVYIVTASGQPVDYTIVDNTAIGVALITDNQKILIEKNGEANTEIIKAAYEADGATDTGYKYFYWGPYGTNVDGITETTDKNVAKADFNGSANTAALQAAADTDSYTSFANMATWCTKFNQTPSENQGYTDWYIPACGQLALMYLNMTAINNALT